MLYINILYLFQVAILRRIFYLSSPWVTSLNSDKKIKYAKHSIKKQHDLKKAHNSFEKNYLFFFLPLSRFQIWIGCPHLHPHQKIDVALGGAMLMFATAVAWTQHCWVSHAKHPSSWCEKNVQPPFFAVKIPHEEEADEKEAAITRKGKMASRRISAGEQDI